MPTDSFCPNLLFACTGVQRFGNLFFTIIVEISEAEFYILTVGSFQVAYIVLMKGLTIRMDARQSVSKSGFTSGFKRLERIFAHECCRLVKAKNIAVSDASEALLRRGDVSLVQPAVISGRVACIRRRAADRKEVGTSSF